MDKTARELAKIIIKRPYERRIQLLNWIRRMRPEVFPAVQRELQKLQLRDLEEVMRNSK